MLTETRKISGVTRRRGWVGQIGQLKFGNVKITMTLEIKVEIAIHWTGVQENKIDIKNMKMIQSFYHVFKLK